MRSKMIPADAEVLRTYDELREFRDSFFNGEFYFLLLVGRQGLSKSWEFVQRCQPYKDRDGHLVSVAHYIKGNSSPVVAYQLAYEHRNKLLTFDDAERLWGDSSGRYPLRDLTECKSRKPVNWQTDNKVLARLGIPKFFETSSRVTSTRGSIEQRSSVKFWSRHSHSPLSKPPRHPESAPSVLDPRITCFSVPQPAPCSIAGSGRWQLRSCPGPTRREARCRFRQMDPAPVPIAGCPSSGTG